MKIEGPLSGLYDAWLRSIKTGEAAAATGVQADDFSREIEQEGGSAAAGVEKAAKKVAAEQDTEAGAGGSNDLEARFAEHLNRVLLRMHEEDEAAGATTGSAAASGAGAGPDVPERTEVTIDGVKVVVSGHSADEIEGHSLLRTLGAEEQKRLQESFIDLQSDPKAFVQAVMEVTKTVPLEALPEGVSRTCMPVTYSAPTGVIGLQTHAADPEIRRSQEQEIVNDFFDLVDVEKQLKAEYGDDVKLAYSHADGGYVMLTPGDLHYNEIASVEQNTGQLLEDISKGAIEFDNVHGILRERGLAA